MSGPSRELPPLRISIVGDNSGAVKAIEGTVKVAKDANKEITKDFRKTSRSIEGDMQERIRRLRKIDTAYRKEREAEDRQANAVRKAVEDERAITSKADQARAKQVEESRKAIAKQTEQLVKEQQAQQAAVDAERAVMSKADQARAKQVEESRKTIQRQTEQYAKERAADIDAANSKLSGLVASGMQIQKERQQQIDKEFAIQRKADEERAKQVAESRKAIAKQTEQLQTEEQQAVTKGRRRRKRHLLDQRKAFEEDVNNRLSHQAHVQRTIANMRILRERADQDEAAENRRILRRSRERLRNRLRAQKAEGQARMAGIKSGLDGGNMMGARADIYMHQETIKSMISGAARLITPFAQVENYTVQMEAFAGSAEAAAKAVEELQLFAVASPYSLEGVLDAATTMMKYGAETEHAIAMTKLLGDVAAGNTNKMELMALAIGQAEALGRLQGQELRQMVNAGFNPLSVAAKEMAKGELGLGADDKAIEAAAKKYMKKFQTAMRMGKLDAGIIEASLQIATSKGGDFAGLSEKQASTLTGLASQIFETLDLAAIEIVKVFAKDLNDLMKTIKKYLDALIAWMKANKDLVRSYVEMGIQIAYAILAFSAMAMGIAYVKWMTGSLITVLKSLWWILSGVTFILRPLIKMLALSMVRMGLFRTQILYLTKAIRVMGSMSAVAWIKMLGPIALVAGAILGLAFLLSALMHKDGFSGVITDWMNWLTFFAGFFWNFSHNIGQIFNWISANWRLMLADMMMGMVKTVLDIAQLTARFIGQEESVIKFREEARTMLATNVLGAESTKYDTSMFKTDMGLGNMAEGTLDFLKPYVKDDPTKIIPDKPDIDFNKFLGGGAGNMVAKAAPAHVRVGSAEHAVQMWEYAEKARASSEAMKQTHEKKTEDLLSKIERNTRRGTNMSGTTTEEAALV